MSPSVKELADYPISTDIRANVSLGLKAWQDGINGILLFVCPAQKTTWQSDAIKRRARQKFA